MAAAAALADDRAMSQRRPGLARGRMQQVQDQGEPAAQRHPSAAGHADLEARGGAEMSVMQEKPLGATLSESRAMWPQIRQTGQYLVFAAKAQRR
jgi:hypothetical protein